MKYDTEKLRRLLTDPEEAVTEIQLNSQNNKKMKNKKRLNCPNCGAPITGIKCEYCGTQFLDFAIIDIDKPFYIRVKQGNHLMTCKARVKEFNITIEQDTPDVLLYDWDSQICYPRCENKMEMELRMESMVRDNNDILYEVMEVNEDE